MERLKKAPSEEQKKEMGWKIDYSVDQFMYCCGGIEVGSLGCYQTSVYYSSSPWGQREIEWYKQKAYASAEEAYKAMLKDVRENHKHFPLMFNLTADLSELRAIIAKEPDATMVHKWRNPNTDNLIEMWVLTNGSDEEYHGSDDDD